MTGPSINFLGKAADWCTCRAPRRDRRTSSAPNLRRCRNDRAPRFIKRRLACLLRVRAHCIGMDTGRNPTFPAEPNRVLRATIRNHAGVQFRFATAFGTAAVGTANFY